MRRQFDEEEAPWTNPRPAYMRELEPLAHPAAWPSQDPPMRVDPVEQEANRRIAIEGLKHCPKPSGRVRELQRPKKAG